MCNKPGTQDNSQKRSAQKMPRCFQRFRTMTTSSYTTNSFTQGSQDLYESPLNSINIYKQHDCSFCRFPKHHFSLGLQYGVSPWDPSSIPYLSGSVEILGQMKTPNCWGVRGCSSPVTHSHWNGLGISWTGHFLTVPTSRLLCIGVAQVLVHH